MKTIDEINAKIRNGNAIVCTAQEFKELVRKGDRNSAEQVDVVTTGTFGVMSGTLAILSVPVAERNRFDRAEKAWLNGVPAFPGPCPNERLGIVDLIVYGTSAASSRYGGGHLFRDLVERKPVRAEVESRGHRCGRDVTLDEMGVARIITTRSAFRNYSALINREPGAVSTIFSVRGLRGPDCEITVSGCGDINPIENDPELRTIGIGTRVLLNGAPGYVISGGTRSTRERPNISVIADMKGMDPRMMGGMRTAHNPECLTSVAVPIPVLDDRLISALTVTNDEIPLPILDVQGRMPCGGTTYGEVWEGTDLAVRSDTGACIRCKDCPPESSCPTGAISDKCFIDRFRCINCGTCSRLCPEGVFTENLGSLTFCGRKVPIVLRQSDRARALDLCRQLKDRIAQGGFLLSEKLGDLQ